MGAWACEASAWYHTALVVMGLMQPECDGSTVSFASGNGGSD